MCERLVSEDLLLIVYCPDKYKTHRMCDEAVDDFLVELKLIPDWFVPRKIIKNFFTALYADDNRFYFSEDSSNVIFLCNDMCILNIDLSNINLDDNCDKDDSDTIILIRLLTWHINF